jgi:hypothetical protein
MKIEMDVWEDNRAIDKVTGKYHFCKPFSPSAQFYYANRALFTFVGQTVIETNMIEKPKATKLVWQWLAKSSSGVFLTKYAGSWAEAISDRVDCKLLHKVEESVKEIEV